MLLINSQDFSSLIIGCILKWVGRKCSNRSDVKYVIGKRKVVRNFSGGFVNSSVSSNGKRVQKHSANIASNFSVHVCVALIFRPRSFLLLPAQLGSTFSFTHQVSRKLQEGVTDNIMTTQISSLRDVLQSCVKCLHPGNTRANVRSGVWEAKMEAAGVA